MMYLFPIPTDLNIFLQGLHHLAAHASSPDPWPYAAQATASSSYHRSVQDLVNSAGSYSSSPASRLQSQYSLFFNSPGSRWHRKNVHKIHIYCGLSA